MKNQPVNLSFECKKCFGFVDSITMKLQYFIFFYLYRRFYAQNESRFRIESMNEVQIDQLVASSFEQNGDWHRCRITKIKPPNLFEVWFNKCFWWTYKIFDSQWFIPSHEFWILHVEERSRYEFKLVEHLFGGVILWRANYKFW